MNDTNDKKNLNVNISPRNKCDNFWVAHFFFKDGAFIKILNNTYTEATEAHFSSETEVQ